MTIGRWVRAIGVALAIIAGVITAHLFQPSHASSLLASLIQSLHGPGFAAVAVLIFYLIGAKQPATRRYILAGSAAALLGLVSEIAQIPGPRDAQLADLVDDGIGIFGALGIIASFDQQIRTRVGKSIRLLLLVFASVALTVTMAPATWYAYVIYQQTMAAPALVTFEHHWETAIFDQPFGIQPRLIAAPANWPNDSGTIAEADESGRYGIFLSLDPIQDWRGYLELSFRAASAGAPFDLAVGVRDQRPGRRSPTNVHYEKFKLTEFPQRFVVSIDAVSKSGKERPFDIANIETVVFSASKPTGKNQLLIDDIRLGRQTGLQD